MKGTLWGNMLNLGYLLSVELSGLTDGLDVGCTGMRTNKMTPRVELEQIYGVWY